VIIVNLRDFGGPQLAIASVVFSTCVVVSTSRRLRVGAVWVDP